MLQEEISIRYEGGDADRHEIDLNQLGISLQGFARIIAVCGNFVETGRYNKQLDSLSVKVLAKEPDEHHCFEVIAAVQSWATSANMWSGAGGGVLAAVVAYVLSSRSNEEMKLLKDALDKSLANSAEMTGRLITTIDKMAEALKPAARQATAPIERTCGTIGLYSGGRQLSELDAGSRALFQGRGAPTYAPTKRFVGVITELDTRTGSCKISLGDLDQRIQCEITDPTRSLPNNFYALSLASQAPFAFLAKAELDANGEIVKLYISDRLPD